MAERTEKEEADFLQTNFTIIRHLFIELVYEHEKWETEIMRKFCTPRFEILLTRDFQELNK